MKTKLVSIIVVLAVGAAVFYYMKERDLSARRAPMLASLKDAESARLRNEHEVKGTPYLCGEVNAKNGMGAYVGFKRYISYPEGYALEGYSIASFYQRGSDADNKYIISHLDHQVAWLKKLRRDVSEDEVDKDDFDALWSSTCI